MPAGNLPYINGFNACLRGETEQCNPHDYRCAMDAHVQWNNGWLAAYVVGAQAFANRNFVPTNGVYH